MVVSSRHVVAAAAVVCGVWCSICSAIGCLVLTAVAVDLPWASADGIGARAEDACWLWGVAVMIGLLETLELLSIPQARLWADSERGETGEGLQPMAKKKTRNFMIGGKGEKI